MDVRQSLHQLTIRLSRKSQPRSYRCTKKRMTARMYASSIVKRSRS